MRRYVNESERAGLGVETRKVERSGHWPTVEHRIADVPPFLDNFADFDPYEGRFKGEEPQNLIRDRNAVVLALCRLDSTTM